MYFCASLMLQLVTKSCYQKPLLKLMNDWSNISDIKVINRLKKKTHHSKTLAMVKI